MSPRTTTDRTSARNSGTRRRRVRVAGVGLLAAVMSLTSLTAGAALLPSDIRSASAGASSPTAGVRLADWTGQPYDGDLPQGADGPASPWSSSQDSTTSTVDSDPASGTESAGVVLVDTVLGDASGAGAGTGIVLTADGQVLTNYHVVEGATSVEVTIATTGRTYTAEVVGHSQSGDVALLQLEDANGLTTATIDDDTVGTGDEVTAVGNAGGTGQLTAADGTVTGLEETITTTAESGVAGETLEGLIQTDADVVAGNSGGPLLDDEGEVIGIDTAASSGSVIDGYAIPIQDALAVVAQIRTGEESATVQVGAGAFLGVQVITASAADARYAYGYGPLASMTSPTSGATAADVVVDGPAATAGLVAGDTITAIGGTAVTSAAQISALLADHDPGDRVQLRWTDGSGVEHDADVPLASSPVA